MSTNKIKTNIYKCQSKLYNYLNNIYIIPDNNINNNISVKTYIQKSVLKPVLKKSKKQKTPKKSDKFNKLNLLIEAVEYIEKQPIENII
jgi:hypothetical protein